MSRKNGEAIRGDLRRFEAFVRRSEALPAHDRAYVGRKSGEYQAQNTLGHFAAEIQQGMKELEGML